jgi:nitrate/nitrite transport system substrate-binding protein
MTFATVFPVSTHNYQLRYWMAQAGIDPDRDVRLVVVPPPQMVANLEAGNIDGYCVGEPWNGRAVAAGLGKVVITSHEIWNNGPEKVLGVNLEWAEKNANTHKALIRALVETARWMDEPANRLEVATLISGPAFLNTPVDIVKMSMLGTFQYALDEPPHPLPDFNVFYRYAATFPWKSHAAWLISQMARWGQINRPADAMQTASTIYRPDIYRDAVKPLGIPVPTIDAKTEGAHAHPWLLTAATGPIEMGPDRFFDGRTFDPRAAHDYLGNFAIARSIEAARPANSI